MGAPMGLFGQIGEVGADRRALAQEAMNRDVARYMYEAQAPSQALQSYMAGVRGDFGGTVEHTPGPVQQAGQLAGLIGGLAGLF